MSSQSKHSAGPAAGTGFGVIAATAMVALGSVAIVFISDAPATASERPKPPSTRAAIDRPQAAPGSTSEHTSRRNDRSPPPGSGYPLPPLLPRLEPRRLLGPADEIAALEAVQIALSEVGDGASYIWHRDHGRLSGVVRPTSSFMDGAGQICRHLHVLLTSGEHVRRAEGVACRDRQGVWSLEG